MLSHLPSLSRASSFAGELVASIARNQIERMIEENAEDLRQLDPADIQTFVDHKASLRQLLGENATGNPVMRFLMSSDLDTFIELITRYHPTVGRILAGQEGRDWLEAQRAEFRAVPDE